MEGAAADTVRRLSQSVGNVGRQSKDYCSRRQQHPDKRKGEQGGKGKGVSCLDEGIAPEINEDPNSTTGRTMFELVF